MAALPQHVSMVVDFLAVVPWSPSRCQFMHFRRNLTFRIRSPALWRRCACHTCPFKPWQRQLASCFAMVESSTKTRWTFGSEKGMGPAIQWYRHFSIIFISKKFGKWFLAWDFGFFILTLTDMWYILDAHLWLGFSVITEALECSPGFQLALRWRSHGRLLIYW